MKQKIINLYKFEELTPEQQEKVIEKYRDFNDDTIESMAQDEYITQPIHESGFLDPTICYDLSYSQGSGACFDCNEFNYDSLLTNWDYKHKNWIINIIKNYCVSAILSNYYANHYSHSKTRYFNLNTYYIEGDYKERTNLIKAIQEATNYIENLRYELSENLTNRLYEELEFLRSDEQIADSLIVNEYYFNGETLEIEE